jgi:hypothetical protein
LVFDETTKSAPYSLLKDFSQKCPLFYLKKGTTRQDLPLNSFLGEFKSPLTRRSSQNIFSKFTFFENKKAATTWNCRRSAYNIRIVAVFWAAATIRIFSSQSIAPQGF